MENLLRQIEELRNKYASSDDAELIDDLEQLYGFAQMQHARSLGIKNNLLQYIEQIKIDVQQS